MNCTYCGSENTQDALVCATCSRDIAIPLTLIAERDELLRKRKLLLDELRHARNEIDLIRGHRKPR
jgi:DNA-directed RNA polymerase subunit RPC12/RpoP